MRYRETIACAALIAAAGAASGQTITQTFGYDWDFLGEEVFLTAAQFDNMGGTRELTGVRMSVVGDYALHFTYHNGDSIALPASEYDPSPTVSANVSPVNASLFLGPVASDFQQLTSVDLAPNDGVFGSGPDETFYAVSGSLDGTIDFNPGSFSEFEGNGFLIFEFGLFANIGLPEGWFAGYSFETFASIGDFSLEYDYVTVPAPASAALIAPGMLAFTRRRR